MSFVMCLFRGRFILVTVTFCGGGEGFQAGECYGKLSLTPATFVTQS